MTEVKEMVASAVVHRVERLPIVTRARDLRDITRDVERWLESFHADDGLLTVMIQHTSASLVLQENADPTIVQDLLAALERFAPDDETYTHRGSGADSMPAHIRAMLTQPSVSIPVHEGLLMLGRRQGLFVAEHRTSPQPRDIAVHFAGTQRAATDGRRAKMTGSAFASAWATS